MFDHIRIEGMQVMAHVGVPDEERARPQGIEISLSLYRELASAGKTDNIQKTVDYFQVQQRTISIAQQKPRKLIETLAEDIASILLKEFELNKIEVEIKKFILQNTRSVSVIIQRTP